METNLDAFFKTDEKLEKEGVWFDVPGGSSFLMKRFGGENSQGVKAAMAAHYKKHSKQIANDTLPADKQLEIVFKTFIASSVVDWKGVKDKDGNELEFSPENCLRLFMRLKKLGETLIEYASDFENFKEELGNF